MARGSMRLAVAAALAGAAASLRVSRPEMSGAYLSNTCWQEEEYDKLVGEAKEQACDLPRYTLDTWVEQNGMVVPDHPAIFVRTHTKESSMPGFEAFLEQFGNRTVYAVPEYAWRNTHLKSPGLAFAKTVSLSRLTKVWNNGKLYYSDTKCHKHSICYTLDRKFGIPYLFRTNQTLKHLHIGGAGSGTPLHKHAAFWQGLSAGRKAWYILPPGSMTEAMADLTGPYILPARTFHGMMRALPLGKRPLYCMQRPGETIFVPEFWWHAAMNMDRFQVAYGGKPVGLVTQPRSEKKKEMMKTFPRQAFDSAGWSAATSGHSKQSWPIPTSFAARSTMMRRSCGEGIESKQFGLEELLQRLKGFTGSHHFDCMTDTIAYAHCVAARTFEEIYLSPQCMKEVDARTRRDHKARAIRWLNEARAISPTLVQWEPVVCKRIPPRGPTNGTANGTANGAAGPRDELAAI